MSLAPSPVLVSGLTLGFLQAEKKSKITSYLATLPAFPFLPPPVYPVMPDDDRLRGKKKRKKEKGVKGPVCERMQEQAGRMDPDQPGTLLLQQSHYHMHQRQPSGSRQGQRIREQEAKLRCSERRELEPEKTGWRGGKLKTKNHTKQTQLSGQAVVWSATLAIDHISIPSCLCPDGSSAR